MTRRVNASGFFDAGSEIFQKSRYAGSDQRKVRPLMGRQCTLWRWRRRFFSKFQERQVCQLQTLNYTLRGKFGGKSQRSGASTIAVQVGQTVDVDSTEKTAYGEPEGGKKCTNPSAQTSLPTTHFWPFARKLKS